MDKPGDEFEDEEIEEEVIVFANFEEGALDRDIFQYSDFKFKAIGLDSETPIVQLGDRIFKGVWNDTVGTKIFFDEDSSPQQVDPVFTVLPPQMLKYKCMTTKTLELSRIFLKPKSSMQKSNNEEILTSANPEEAANENSEVSHLIQSTISPTSDALEVLNNIVAETAMETEQ